MLIIPAIDIKDGRCVRLFQGEMDKETVYFENPLDAARHWVSEGATFIHIVDLNGAIEGLPEQIVVAIDARNGKVAVKGWKETTSMDAVELAKRCEQDGASRIIYTDIS